MFKEIIIDLVQNMICILFVSQEDYLVVIRKKGGNKIITILGKMITKTYKTTIKLFK